MRHLKKFEQFENEEWFDEFNEDDEVTCPDCEGTGIDESGRECERCDGLGRVYRPDDIPPDDIL